MQFLFHLWNHSKLGKLSLHDVIGIMGHQLRALGHTAFWDPDNDARDDGSYDLKFIAQPNSYNVIVEGFTKEINGLIARSYDNGARFICIATEEPTPKGFNHGIMPEMRRRQEMFPEAAKYFDGILHLVPGQHVTDWYNKFAPSFQCDLGYAPNLIRTETIINPKYDFGFFGSLSPRRRSILGRLAKRTNSVNAVRVVATFPDQFTRDKEIQNCKVVVNLRKFDKMGLVSTSRCNTALNLGRPVVSEPHDYCKPWDEIVKFSKTEGEFYNLALAVRGIWRNVHAWQFEKFKEKLTPQVCIGFAVDEIHRRRLEKEAA